MSCWLQRQPLPTTSVSVCLSIQWRRQLCGTGARAPLDFQQFHFSSLWSKSDSQLSKCCVVCEISRCRCQQLTALSISTALVTKLLVIEQLLQPALKSIVSAPWHNLQLCNKSWRRHCVYLSVCLPVCLSLSFFFFFSDPRIFTRTMPTTKLRGRIPSISTC